MKSHRRWIWRIACPLQLWRRCGLLLEKPWVDGRWRAENGGQLRLSSERKLSGRDNFWCDAQNGNFATWLSMSRLHQISTARNHIRVLMLLEYSTVCFGMFLVAPYYVLPRKSSRSFFCFFLFFYLPPLVYRVASFPFLTARHSRLSRLTDWY